MTTSQAKALKCKLVNQYKFLCFRNKIMQWIFYQVHLTPITFSSMLFVLFVTHSHTHDVVKLLEMHVDSSDEFYVHVQSIWTWVKFSCCNKSNYEGDKFGTKIVFCKVHLAPIMFLSMFFVLFVTHSCTDNVVELLEIHVSMWILCVFPISLNMS